MDGIIRQLLVSQNESDFEAVTSFRELRQRHETFRKRNKQKHNLSPVDIFLLLFRAPSVISQVRRKCQIGLAELESGLSKTLVIVYIWLIITAYDYTRFYICGWHGMEYYTLHSNLALMPDRWYSPSEPTFLLRFKSHGF